MTETASSTRKAARHISADIRRKIALQQKSAAPVRAQAAQSTAPPELSATAWDRDRPYLIRGFDAPPSEATRLAKLCDYPNTTQDSILADDLLHVLVGVPGRYIVFTLNTLPHPPPPLPTPIPTSISLSFHPAAEGGHPALLHLSSSLFPLAGDLYSLTQTSHRYRTLHSGSTLNALSSFLHGRVHSLRSALASLPSDEPLNRLVFLARPYAREAAFWCSVVRSVGDARGAAVLVRVEASVRAGLNEEWTNDLADLMDDLSRPMVQFLKRWMSRGVVDDPFEEFFVRLDPAYALDRVGDDYDGHYWSKRFVLRDNAVVPKSLVPFLDRVLRLGKYMNVLRDSGVDAVIPHFDDDNGQETQTSVQHLIERIDPGLQVASDLVLRHFMQSMGLLARLRSVKSFFLVDRGDYLTHFLDVANDELQKPVDKASVAVLTTCLEHSIRASALSQDMSRGGISCTLLPHSFIHRLMKIRGEDAEDEPSAALEQGRAVDRFSLTYRIEWPVSLILSSKALTKYQLLFRLLLRCRVIERQLNQCWTKLHKRWQSTVSSAGLSGAYALLQKMMSFLESLLRFVTVEVLEPNWHLLENRLKEADSLDRVISVHDDFLDTCLKECMLTSSTLFKMMVRLLTTSQAFCKLMNKHDDTSGDTQGRFLANLSKAKATFDKHVRNLITSLSGCSVLEGDPHLSTFGARLDFNGFYANSLNPMSED